MSDGKARFAGPRPRGRDIVRFWTGFLGPPVIWLCDLAISYALADWVCGSGRAWILDAVAATALALVALTTWLSWRLWRDLGGGDAGETVRGRRRLGAIGGMTNGAFFAVVIIATAIPNFVLRGCP